MRIAIYSRKSKATGKGESVENQLQLCREYCSRMYNLKDDFQFQEYPEEEGYSGKDTERPEFQRMLQDARTRKFDILVVYRLDRFSRSISDFSKTIEELQSFGVSFVSIREQFDTSTPMGRAMMYIASVFAQLERETIAERIRDNMLLLAKTGRWLGGTTPIGFRSKEVIKTVGDDVHKQFKLVPVQTEMDMVVMLFDKYMELQSLSKLEAYCYQLGLKSRKGVSLSRFTLRKILDNPVYMVADAAAHQFFVANGYDVASAKEQFDGRFGIMPYNRTLQRKHKARVLRDAEDVIIAVGSHQGVVSSSKWIATQALLVENKEKSPRQPRVVDALLSGLLRCGQCGSSMRPKSGRTKQSGEQVFYYVCLTKEHSQGVACDMANAPGFPTDTAVVSEIMDLAGQSSDLGAKLQADEDLIKQQKSDLAAQVENVKAQITENDGVIANLIRSLGAGVVEETSKIIIARLNELSSQNSELKNRLLSLENSLEAPGLMEDGLAAVRLILSSFKSAFEGSDFLTKRSMVRAVVERVVWDGLHADIYMLGDKSLKR